MIRKCPSCDRVYRCSKCNGDRMAISGSLYNKTRYKCGDCGSYGYRCRLCIKEAQTARENARVAKLAAKSKPKKRRWAFY